MSASTATDAVAAKSSLVAPVQDGLTADELAALTATMSAQSLLGVSAMSTRLLNQIALQVEQGVTSLTTIAGPFDGHKGALTTQGSLDSDTVDRFAKAAAKVVQDAVKSPFDAVQASLAKAQSELETERTWSAAAGVRIDKLEALTTSFDKQTQIATLIGELVAENRGIGRELACICRSARAIAWHMCGKDPDEGHDRQSQWVDEVSKEIWTAHERMERFEHEVKASRPDHELRGVVEKLREVIETRIAEVEVARLAVVERALEQHEHINELRTGHAAIQGLLARLERRVIESLEAQEIKELVAQTEARLSTRLGNLAAEREDHFRRAANAAERALAISGEHERMRDRLDRLPGEIIETLEHKFREFLAGHDARLGTRLAEITSVSEASLRRSEETASRLESLHHHQSQLNERIEQMATAAEGTMRAILADTIETRFAEFTAARDTDVLRAEVSDKIGVLQEEQKATRVHLERLAHSVSDEARERQISEHLARERQWVEARLAEHGPPARGQSNRRP